jgi:hypothetical protein
MSSIIPSVDFSSDPLKKYKELREAIHSRAATLCLELNDGGLAGMGHHLTDEEFVNMQDAQDPNQPGEKIIFMRPAALALGATTGATNVYKFAREDYHCYQEGYTVLRDETIASLGGVIQRQLSQSGSPVTVKTINEIINHVKGIYGKTTQVKYDGLKEKLKAKCISELEALNYCQELGRIYKLLEEIRDPIGELSKMEWLTKGTRHLPLTREALEDYVKSVPDMEMRTFQCMSDHLTMVVPNFCAEEGNRRHTAYGATTDVSGGGEQGKLDMVLAVIGTLSDKMSTIEKKLRTAKGGKPPSGGTVPYCFIHGNDKKHTGMECRGMKTGFTMAQRCATGPGLIDGKVGAA